MARRLVLPLLLPLAIALLSSPAEAQVSTITLPVTSPAFTNGGAIPTKFTCDGPGTAPPLSWSNLPAGTRSVAVVVEDPDAPGGTFTHWVIYDLPPTINTLDEGVGVPQQAQQGLNSKGQMGWTPPCPPSGTHHYHFRVFALDTTMNMARVSADGLLRAMKGRTLAQGEIVGTYQRGKK
jgi:Raf kinase inhibitor-like YbhB/YbcL family protein